MGLFDHFPYTNVHELNLDWVLYMMKAIEAEWEAFTAGNSLTFADPLQHDISKTYAKNTIVLDNNGDAYVSLQAVPVGVALSNQDYWLMVFDYEAFIEKVNKNFTARYYRGQYRATTAMAIGDWLTVDDVLCKATAAIAIDDVLEVGVNIEHFTLEDFIKAFMTSANQMIQQYKNDIDASELAYRNQLAQDIANTTASLQAQLNTAISGATVDSEVINARVGWNGIIYPTLGDALREQTESASGYSSYKLFDASTWNIGRVDASTGAIAIDNDNIYSCFINCAKDYHLTIRSKIPSAYYFGVFAYNQDGSYVSLSKDVSGRYFDSRYAQNTHPGTENMLYRIDLRRQPAATITDIEDLISNYEITLSKNIDTVAMDYDIPVSSWTRGSLDATTGAEIGTTSSMRTDFIKFPATGKFKISVDAGYYFALFKYDEDETFVSVDHSYGSKDFVCVDTTSLYRVVLRNEPATTNSTRISQIIQIRAIHFTIYVEDINSLLNDKITACSSWIDNTNTESLSDPEQWAIGSMDATTGADRIADYTIRTTMIKLYNGEALEVINSDPSVILFAVFRYNADGSFDSVIKSFNTQSYYTEDSSYLYRIACRYTDSSVITDKSAFFTYLNAIIHRTQPRKMYEYDSVLKNKRWIVCGDSFTHGDFTSAPDPTATILDNGLYVGQNAVYPFYIGNRTGAIIEQYAANGMSLADTGSNSFTDKYQYIPADADYITMYFGINDKIAGVAIGDADSTDITEFNGAWNVILTWLRNNRPFAHVGIIISNSAGSSAIPYVNATRDMAIKYGYSYLDMQKDDSLPAMAFEQQRDLDPTIASLIEGQFAVNLLASNAHPNEKAHLYESYFIEDWLHKL